MKNLPSSRSSIAFLFMLASVTLQADPLTRAEKNRHAITSSGLTVAPSGFEENKGQVLTIEGNAAPFVRYRLTQGNTSIFLLGNGIAFQFDQTHYPEGYVALANDVQPDREDHLKLDSLCKKVRIETYRMDMLLEGANEEAHITAEDRSSDYTNYYTYDALDVHTYTRVTYHEVYPGIDWVVYTTAKGIKYDFVVRPGADPSRIQLRFKDQEELYVDSNGHLIHGNRLGRFTEEQPVSLQNGREVKTRFVLDGDLLRFGLDPYNSSQPIIIDPARIWATYYGGKSAENGLCCSVDDSGDVYMAGWTSSLSGIASGGYQSMYGGADMDAFLVKFNTSGTRQWAIYYGGSGSDLGRSCTVDDIGNVYLAGWTSSENAIASGGQQNSLGGQDDAFLVKFNAIGFRQWGTYYGGTEEDNGQSCAVDGTGNIYLAGSTYSENAIASGGHQNTFGGFRDALIVKFNGEGVRQWASYYGGTDFEIGASCAVDAGANVYLAGVTHSAEAIASNGHQNALAGIADAFLVKFNPDGVRQWATYYGGAMGDGATSCAVDENDGLYLAGFTTSEDAIASGGAQSTLNGDVDAFLVKFNLDGVRQWATYYGGLWYDRAESCSADHNGNVYLAGWTDSDSAIATGGYQNEISGFTDAFLVKFNSDGAREWGTYYGSIGYDEAYGCAVSESDIVYLAGWTNSHSAIASGGYQTNFGGGSDAFLVKFDADSIASSINSPEVRHQSFSIWPDPTVGDHFFLQAQGSGIAEVQLFDALGQLEQTQHLQLAPGQAPVEITLGSDMAKGLYMVRVTVEGRSSVAPMVIE